MQVLCKVPDDGNRATTSRENGGRTEDVAERFRGYLHGRMIGIHQQARAFAQHCNLHGHTARCVRFHECFERRDDLIGVLIRNKTDAYFSGRFGGNHRLASRARETTRNPVDFESRPRPDAFENRVVQLSSKLRRAHLGL